MQAGRPDGGPQGEAMPRQTERTGQATPLWIISIFIGLSEVVAGVVATQSSGWIAGTFAIFAVAYPIAVTTLFFVILWKRNWIFYPPSEFSEHVRPTEYIEAMRNQAGAQLRAYGVALELAVDKGVSSIASEIPAETSPDQTAKRAAAEARRELKNLSIEVDISGIDPQLAGSDPLRFFPGTDSTVADFLNFIYFGIADFVRPFQYTTQWILVDDTGRVFDEIGTRWATSHGMREDRRLLELAGIRSGDHLKAMRP